MDSNSFWIVLKWIIGFLAVIAVIYVGYKFATGGLETLLSFGPKPPALP